MVMCVSGNDETSRFSLFFFIITEFQSQMTIVIETSGTKINNVQKLNNAYCVKFRPKRGYFNVSKSFDRSNFFPEF